MVWFKVDDGFPSSRPVLSIPRRARASAVGLWTLAGAWSAKELTDGFIASHMLAEFASTAKTAQVLVDAGLWETAENGWRFRNWARYQPTREEVLARRDLEAERKRNQRASRRRPSGTDGGLPEGRDAASDDPVPDPPRTRTSTDVPSVEDPSAADAAAPARKKRKTGLPSNFGPNDNHRARAAEHGLDIVTEVEKFVDHHFAKGSQFVSWDAALNTWLRNAVEFKRRDAAAVSRPSPTSLLPKADELEEPPPFLTSEQYQAWQREKPGRR